MRAWCAASVSLVLAGCQSLAAHPELYHLTPIPPAPREGDPTSRTALELKRVTAMGNAYRNLAASLGGEDRASGGLILLSGFYGAATSAFRPVIKNLQAAILAQGVTSAWRTSLKPSERAKVYVQGYRALDCVHNAGAALLDDEANGAPVDVRSELDELRGLALDARETLTSDPNADKALLARVEVQIAKLAELDKFLRLEEAAIVDGPYRIARVRQQIEDTIDKRLMAAAPDYAGALKLIGETAKPVVPTARAPAGGPPMAAAAGADPAATIAEIAVRLPILEGRIPNRAASAYERMGACITSLG